MTLYFSRRGEVPYTALTILAIITLISAALFFVFGVPTIEEARRNQNISLASPTPYSWLSIAGSLTPSAWPSSSAGASVAPSAPAASLEPEASLEPWPSTPAAPCAETGCLPEKPFYCSNGTKISNCAKCGCPAYPPDLVCGMGSVMTPCECIDVSLMVENCSYLMGPGGNMSEIFSSPTPSPSPTPPPCVYSNYSAIYGANASAVPYHTDFMANVSSAYNRVFGNTLTWTHPAYYLWVGSDVNNPQNIISIYKGYYHGWSNSYDVVFNVLANQSLCFKPTVIHYDVTGPPWEYQFKQSCWDWAYLIDAQIHDNVDGTPSKNRGSLFAENAADICPP